MTKLIIVESPGKIEKIKSYLGAGWDVMASYGHIRDLPEKEMGFAPPDFRPKYEPSEKIPATIAKLKRAAQAAETVYLATDPDREGESIAWHLKEALGLENPQRITFSEINATSVKKAVISPRAIDMKLVAAQELRRILDRDVGYSVSPALSKQAGENLSAGRVQSPAVRLVVDRERAIRNFKPTQHFGVELQFGEWIAEWNVKQHLAGHDEYLLDRTFAEQVAKVSHVDVISFEATEGRRAPPAPFTTSTLQQAASNKLGFNPDYTMRLAQKLYESGLEGEGAITYMRTDNPNLSQEALGELFVEAQKRGLTMADKPRTWKAKEGAQEAHEAIRPTHFEFDVAGNTDDEKALYLLIWKRAMACQLEDALYNVRRTSLRGITDGKPVSFDATGRALKRKGWLAILDGDDTEDVKDNDALNPIPDLKIGQTLSVQNGKLLIRRTKAPARYTQASLIKKLEDEGIGRPSTYAAILNNIEDRGYVAENKTRQLLATPLGEKIVDGLVNHFSFIDLIFTKTMESTCDLVAQGKTSYKATITEFHKTLTDELERYGSTIAIKPAFPCPDCGKALRRISGKEAGSFFWGCGGHPECTTKLPDINGKPGPKKAATAVSQHKCPECGSNLINRTGPAKPGKSAYNFWGCSGWPKCKSTFENANGKPGKAK